MTAVSYHYNKIVAPDRLEFEITTNTGITVKLDATAGHGILATSTDVTIWFLATLSSTEESVLAAIINSHVAIPLQYQGEPTDPDGAKIQRPKAAKAGWAFQLHAVSFTTAKISDDGLIPGCVYNHSLNPNTLVEAPLGFSTVHFFDANKVAVTAPQHMDQVVYTQLDWMVNHDMEIVAATHFQPVTPPNDLWLWTHLAPPYVNYPFGQGGINLRMVGSSASGTPLDSDGRVSKFLSATVPMAGLNKFRLTLKSGVAGYQHESMMVFKLFKSVT